MFLPSRDFYIYIQYMICFYKCTAWKKKKRETLLGKGTAINTKPTWASHIPTGDPGKRGRQPSPQPPAPRSPQPDGPSNVNQRPSAPTGSAGHARPWHLRRECPLTPAERGGGNACRVRKRGRREMCSSTKGTCQRPPTAIPRARRARGVPLR